jgi:2-polyprenyl-3-methyl-5-hydroxy-6-metoxy-1,4-benzoquinol methylase
MFTNIFAHFPLNRMMKGPKSRSAQSSHHQPDWDSMYEQGEWDYLTKIDELGHYSLLVGYCQYLNPKGKILDIGCGEGLLQQQLRYLPYQSYLGVDVSNVAIA